MDPNALAEVDRQIAQLKKELNSLFGKRIAILQDEIKRSEAEAQALSVAVIPASSQPKVKRPRQAKPVTTNEEHPSPLPVQAAKAPAQAVALAEEEKKTETKPEPEAQPARRRSASPNGETPILDALREAGLFGLTVTEIGQKTPLSSQAITKQLKELPGITKKGTGKEARYYLKS